MAGSKDKDDEQQALDRALDRGQREDMLGDMEENRNVSGSTTWETLGDKINDENQQHGRKGQAQSPREIRPEDQSGSE
jgi:hypothetical protein